MVIRENLTRPPIEKLTQLKEQVRSTDRLEEALPYLIAYVDTHNEAANVEQLADVSSFEILLQTLQQFDMFAQVGPYIDETAEGYVFTDVVNIEAL